MPKSLKELADERNKLLKDNRDLLDTAEAEGRSDLSADEAAEYAKREADLENLDDEIQKRTNFETRKQRQSAAELQSERVLPRQTSSIGVPKPGATDNRDESLTVNFGRAGDFHLAAGHAAYARATAKYQEVFRAYLHYKPGDYESLGLQVAIDPKGGYAVPMATLSGLIKFLDDSVTMRKLGTVLPPTQAKSVGMLSYDTDYADADWTAEVPASDISEDDAARFGKREMTPNLLTKEVQASRKLLSAQTPIGIEAFISQRLGYKFAITENKGFLTGNGSQRPLGVFVASNDGIPTSRDVTASGTPAGTAFTADDLIDTEESTKDVYQARGSWLGSRGFRQRCRKLKDGNGQYMLRGANTAGGSAIMTLNEHPLYVDENAPSTFTTGLYVAVFGDFSFYYIQDGMDMEIQRLDELNARKNKVGWIARKETDGMPVLAEAFARLKLA